jgi:hypothetical protein
MGVGLLAASAASGALSRCIVHPLDTLRARIMVSQASSGPGVGLVSSARAAGLRSLYQGIGVSVVMQAPAVATYLTSYEHAKAAIATTAQLSDKHPAVHLSAGLIAETVSAVFWVPMEVVKQRAQIRTGASSSFAVARDLLRHEGPRAFFNGYALTVGVFGPYSMFYFVSYEQLKDMWARRLAVMCHEDLPLYAVASSASLAGATAGALTCPLDIIKTRLQTQGDIARLSLGVGASPGANASASGAVLYKGTWHAAKTILIEEGMRGFLRGVSARVLWIMPGTAITMTTFEFLKSTFKLRPPPLSPPSPSTGVTTL